MRSISQRQLQIITIIGLCIAIVCLTIAYAVMNIKLKITGNVDMDSANWDIHFEDVNATTTGNASYTIPSIDGTTMKDYQVTITKPGDFVYFNIKIINNGNIPATLNKVTITTPNCISPINNTNDEEIVCTNLSYNLLYADGTQIQNGDYLPAGSMKELQLKMGYKEEATTLPSSSVSIENLEITLNYLQN